MTIEQHLHCAISLVCSESRLLTLHNQESAQQSPNPFSCEEDEVWKWEQPQERGHNVPTKHFVEDMEEVEEVDIVARKQHCVTTTNTQLSFALSLHNAHTHTMITHLIMCSPARVSMNFLTLSPFSRLYDTSGFIQNAFWVLVIAIGILLYQLKKFLTFFPSLTVLGGQIIELTVQAWSKLLGNQASLINLFISSQTFSKNCRNLFAQLRDNLVKFLSDSRTKHNVGGFTIL